MKLRLLAIGMLFLAGCTAMQTAPKVNAPGEDDSNVVNTLDSVNPASGNFGNAQYPTQLYNSLTKEQPNRDLEHGFPNCVATQTAPVPTSNPNSCLGTTSAGLTMTPTSCVAYNAGYRGTEVGSITFTDSKVTWVAMDENTSGNNAGIPTFTRVVGTHYLTDNSSVTAPAMAADSQLLMQVTTSGGAITLVNDYRNTNCAIASGAFNGTSFGTGIINVRNPPYNASGELTKYTGISCNGTAVTGLPSGNDFINGQGIVVSKCGASTTFNSGGTACSAVTPTAPATVTQAGSAGATSYCYKEQYMEDDAGGAGGTSKLSSATCLNTVNTTTFAGSTQLLTPVVITLGTDSVAGVYSHIIWRSKTGSGGTFTPWGYTVATGGTGFVLYDSATDSNMRLNNIITMPTGFDIPASAPPACQTNHYLGKVVSGGGTPNLVVTPSTGTTTVATSTAIHEDHAAINQAIADANAAYPGNPPLVYFPSHDSAGLTLEYRLLLPLNETGTVVTGGNGVSLIGDGDYTGRAGFYCDTGPYACFEQIGISGLHQRYIALASGLDDITPSQVGIIRGPDLGNEFGGGGLFSNDQGESIIIYGDPNQHCSSGTTTGCYGTIGVMNWGNDAHDWNNMYFQASTPMFIQGDEVGTAFGGSNYGITSLYDTVPDRTPGAFHGFTFSGFTTFAAGAGPAMAIEGYVGGLKIVNGLWFNGGDQGSYQHTAADGTTAIGQWNPNHPWEWEFGTDRGWAEIINGYFYGEMEGFNQAWELSGGSVGNKPSEIYNSDFEQQNFFINSLALNANVATLPIYEDRNITAAGQQHYIIGNTFKLSGTGLGVAPSPLLGFKIDNAATQTIFTGNDVSLNQGINFDYSHTTQAGGNIFRLGSSWFPGVTGDKITPPTGSLGDGNSGDIECYSGACTIPNLATTLVVSNNHINYNPIGAASGVTLASCGTGSLGANSGDEVGTVTATGATSCQVVFSTVVTNTVAPVCMAMDITTPANLLQISGVTTAHFTVGGLTSNDVFEYICKFRG